MKQAYIDKAIRGDRLSTIATADAICRQYAAQGFRLTVRQLYYQFVARGLLPNTVQNYKRLADTVADGRLAGLLDWDWIEDRLRTVAEQSHWRSPSQIMTAVAQQYRIDKWSNQTYHPIVMIEKDALAGVIEPTCQRLDVPYLACRGYVSVSALRELSQRLLGFLRKDQVPVVLHLGDHDPSGIDMTRDIRDRLALFLGGNIELRRLALNMDQVQQYNPPPNPAKETDARFAGYIRVHGSESWELDALDPTVISTLVEDAVLSFRDDDLWAEAQADEEEQRGKLVKVANRWDEVADYVA